MTKEERNVLSPDGIAVWLGLSWVFFPYVLKRQTASHLSKGSWSAEQDNSSSLVSSGTLEKNNEKRLEVYEKEGVCCSWG